MTPSPESQIMDDDLKLALLLDLYAMFVTNKAEEALLEDNLLKASTTIRRLVYERDRALENGQAYAFLLRRQREWTKEADAREAAALAQLKAAKSRKGRKRRVVKSPKEAVDFTPAVALPSPD